MKKIVQFRINILSFFLLIMCMPQVGISQDSLEVKSKSSLFDYIYQMEGKPKIVLDTDIHKLISKKISEEYQKTSFQVSSLSSEDTLILEGRIRARGNVRKKVSYLPPVKVDFNKSNLDSLGFLKLDKLKFVFPKDKSKKSQKLLLKEYFLYELYAQLDSNSIRAKLVDILILKKGKKKLHFTGFMIEDEGEYARSNNAIIVERGKLRHSALDRASFLKMVFFQYMIANTDYSVSSKHNLEIVKLPQTKKVVAMPYDFDYSGFVGHEYAVPFAQFPIVSVQERYLYPGYRVSESEYDRMVNYFLSKKDRLYNLCDNAKYMNSKSIKESKAYLASFYKLLGKPKKLKRDLVKR